MNTLEIVFLALGGGLLAFLALLAFFLFVHAVVATRAELLRRDSGDEDDLEVADTQLIYHYHYYGDEDDDDDYEDDSPFPVNGPPQDGARRKKKTKPSSPNDTASDDYLND